MVSSVGVRVDMMRGDVSNTEGRIRNAKRNYRIERHNLEQAAHLRNERGACMIMSSTRGIRTSEVFALKLKNRIIIIRRSR